MVMEALVEIETELTVDEEYEAVKAIEVTKQKISDETERKASEMYTRQLKNGLCPKCGTYCYGDCEA